jgi:hypothetical protein
MLVDKKRKVVCLQPTLKVLSLPWERDINRNESPGDCRERSV